MQNPFNTLPPAMVVAVIGTVSWAIVAIVLGVAFFRYRWRRAEEQHTTPLPSDVSARLARIETAVESIAIEVERISESQRFLARLEADHRPLPAGSERAPERQR